MSELTLPAIAAGSPARFGYEWRRYCEMQPEYEEQFRRWTAVMPLADWRGVSFLDAGCGMGRNSFWPVAYGAQRGVAIDVDDGSLDAARRTLAGLPVEVRRQSIYDIAPEGAFDIAFSIGVIHHLEHPDRALKAMRDAVKPGGRVMIWVYGYENNEYVVRWLSPIRRALFSRMPIGFLHHLSLYPAALLWMALRCGLQSIEYFRLIRRLSFPHLRSIVFDQMLPKIANYWCRDEVEALMRGAGLVDLDIAWVNEMSWSAVGRRP